MSDLITVYCGACGGPVQVAASDLSYQDPPVTQTCPRCGITLQISN